MSEPLRQSVREEMAKDPRTRLGGVLRALDVAASSWYRPAAGPARPPGPAPKPVPPEVVRWVVEMARANPWYGYKRIAVMCRRARQPVKNRQAYQVMAQADLLHRRVCRKAELYQTAKLFELLPSGPNQLWQMDVTYLHIPGYGWWYAVTVIDYYSRYLLAAHLTNSYSAREVTKALALAREEAERLNGPLVKRPFLVTDNGPSFVAKWFGKFVQEQYGHVRIAYRTPTQLGLLERFHRTLKEEEVYWRIYDSPAHARDCLGEFRQRYNQLRPHWALRPEGGGDPLVPYEVYALGRKVGIPKWQGWAVAARERLEQLLAQEAAA